LFHTKDLHVPEMQRLRPFGSDHFTMLYKIAFPIIDVDVENPLLSSEIIEEIEEIIEDGDQSVQEAERES